MISARIPIACVLVIALGAGTAWGQPPAQSFETLSSPTVSMTERGVVVLVPDDTFSLRQDYPKLPKLDPQGDYVIYKVNNAFGKGEPSDSIVSHSFLVAYNERTGQVERAYSFINQAGIKPFGSGAWEAPDKPQNIEGGRLAVESLLKDGKWAAKEVGRGYDVVLALDQEFVVRSQNPASFAPWRNCKVEANRLLADGLAKARRYQMRESLSIDRHVLAIDQGTMLTHEWSYRMMDQAQSNLRSETFGLLDELARDHTDFMSRSWQEYRAAEPAISFMKGGIDIMRDMPSALNGGWDNAAKWQTDVLKFGLSSRDSWLELTGRAGLGRLASTAGAAWGLSEDIRRGLNTLDNLDRAHNLLQLPSSNVDFWSHHEYGGGMLGARDRAGRGGSYVFWDFEDTSEWGWLPERPGIALPIPGPIVDTTFEATAGSYWNRRKLPRGEILDYSQHVTQTHHERYNRFDFMSPGMSETTTHTHTSYTYRFNGAQEQAAIDAAMRRERGGPSNSTTSRVPDRLLPVLPRMVIEKRDLPVPPDDRYKDTVKYGSIILPPKPPPLPVPIDDGDRNMRSGAGIPNRMQMPSIPQIAEPRLNRWALDTWRTRNHMPRSWRSPKPVPPLAGIMLAPELEVVVDESERTSEFAAAAVKAAGAGNGGTFTVGGKSYIAVKAPRSGRKRLQVGYFHLRQRDVAIAGNGPLLELVRYYSSFDGRSTALGKGWSFAPFALRIGSAMASENSGRKFGRRIALLDYTRGSLTTYLGSRRLPDDNVVPNDHPPLYHAIAGAVAPFLSAQPDGTYFVTFPHAMVARFGSDGRLTHLIYPDGTLTYSYTGDRLTKISRDDTAILLDFDPNGKLIGAHGPDKQRVAYQLLAGGNLQRATGGADGDHVFTYGDDGLIDRIDRVEASGRRTLAELRFDRHGRMLSKEADGRAWSFAYDESLRRVTIRSNGQTMSRYYNGTGQLVAYGADREKMTLLNTDAAGRVLQVGEGRLVNDPSPDELPRFKVDRVLGPAAAIRHPEKPKG